LRIEVNTVKTHVRSILRKTGRINRIDLLGSP
jgi:DNA-binding NarL/FixJ family response regulator